MSTTYGVATNMTSRGGRAYSFEDTMLPPSASGAGGGATTSAGGETTSARLQQQQQQQLPHDFNPAYSPYGGSTTSSGGGGGGSGTLFANQWPYAGPPPDIYGNTPPSPLQPRSALHMPPPLPHHPGTAAMGYPHHPGPHVLGMRPMAPPPPPIQGGGHAGAGGAPHNLHAQYMTSPGAAGGGGSGGAVGATGAAPGTAGFAGGIVNPLPPHSPHHPLHPVVAGGPFANTAAAAAAATTMAGFPTSSPGPPIQTTASNKGPDGANLFIFHIPNHFTNLDMYQLFEPYGILLSVRIMVERDTGRSRGFGFVSYDSPESAALAIKALNGFTVRLIVCLYIYMYQK